MHLIEPKWCLDPLPRLHEIMKPCEEAVDVRVLFTIKLCLLSLIYELRCEAVKESYIQIRKGR